MFKRLLLIFILVPCLEIIILIQVGKHIGFWPTLFMVFVLGTLGYIMVRSQGLSVYYRVREEIRAGCPPADALLDGILVLSGGLLLITPGLLTDAVGISLMIPLVRARIKKWLKFWILYRLKTGTWVIKL